MSSVIIHPYTLFGGVSVSYHGYFLDAANDANLRTFSSVPFGNPAADREIVVAVPCGMNAAAPTVVIGGVSATPVSAAWDSSWGASIQRATVPTGTSGTITVDPDTTSNGVAIFVFSISRIGTDPADVSAGHAIGGGPQTLDTLEGGVLVGIISSRSATGTGQYTISNFDSVFQDKYESGNGFGAVCYLEKTPADETARSFSGSGATSWGAAIASFGPD